MDIKKIVDSLTDEQLAEYIRGKGNWHLFSNKKLGVKRIKVSDGPHGMRTEPDKEDNAQLGLASTYKSVCFPSMSLTSCSFNRELINEMGRTMAEEAKHLGVNIILGPAINIKRDPKCGRNFEYISEDPYIVGELASSYIDGVQKQGIGTSIKHFACNNCELDRMVLNSVVDERALREIYLRGFEKAIKRTQPQTVMASYNKVNGRYSTENYHLLTEILRDEWGFEGIVISDWVAVDDINEAVLAGTDLEMPESGAVHYKDSLKGIQSNPKVKEAYKQAISRQLNIINKSIDLNPDFVFDYEADHKLAKKIADDSIVLLKNVDEILPLKKEEKVLFVGALADEPRYQGGGSSNINPYKITKMSELIVDNPNIEIVKGYEITSENDNPELLKEAVEKAKNADKVVCFVGFNHIQESEGFDKKDLKFYQNQINLINEIYNVCQNLVVVLENGSVIEIPFIDKTKGVVEAYLGGEAINESIYDVLYGKVNPSGRLTETFAKTYEEYPSSHNFTGDHANVLYKESIFVGYRYFDTFKKDVLFPFGYGLSYTEFECNNLKINTTENSVKVTIDVKNIGPVKGKETVQIYIKNPAKPEYFSENKALKGFEKVELNPNEEKTVIIEIPFEDIKVFNIKSNKFELLNGCYMLYVSKHSFDETLFGRFNVTNGVDIFHNYTNVPNYFSGDIAAISDKEFSELFINKKLPTAYRDLSKFDMNTSIKDALDRGSKGAKKVVNFVSKLKMFKKDPGLLGFFINSSIRGIYCGVNGKLSLKNMKIFIHLLNDEHIHFNFFRLLCVLIKLI